MTNFLKNFWNDEEGATAIEYGLIAGLIAVSIIAAASALAGGLNDLFCGIANLLGGLGTAGTTPTFTPGACT
ncbi:MAG: Flp family type IVb pilin [Comamonas sp.]